MSNLDFEVVAQHITLLLILLQLLWLGHSLPSKLFNGSCRVSLCLKPRHATLRVSSHPKNLATTLRIASLERELGLSFLAQRRPG